MIFFNMVSDEELEAYEKEYLKRLEQKKHQVIMQICLEIKNPFYLIVLVVVRR